MFPSTYVEKIQDNNAAPNARAYKPFGAAYHGSDAYPPPMNNAMGGQVVEVNPNQNAVVVQQDVAGQEKKKNKFGKYGNTIAQSAAGGLGECTLLLNFKVELTRFNRIWRGCCGGWRNHQFDFLGCH